MNERILSYLSLASLLFLVACGQLEPDPQTVKQAVDATLTAQAGRGALEKSSPSTPTPNRVETRVAEEKTVFAQLTADAKSAAEDDTPAPATETATGLPQPTEGTVTPASRRCTVVARGLNLREGPDTVYDPPIAVLSEGDIVVPQGRNPDGTWIHVRVPEANQTGWLRAAAQLVTCNVDVLTLALVEVPPTPTPFPAATLLPTGTPSPAPLDPTPTPPLLVVEPIEGSGEWLAQIIHPDYFPAATSDLVFRVRAYDATVGTNDGDGIDFVDFFIFDEEDELVHERREMQPAYCAFGGNEPQCSPWVFADHSFEWPSGRRIESGTHTLEVEVHGAVAAEDGEEIIRRGEVTFRIQLLAAVVVQTAPGETASAVTDALVFQVRTYNPVVGNDDGAGIASVDMRIVDGDGNEVHQRTEQNAGYCAFGGGEPDCNVWVFADHDNRWPDGTPIEAGTYTLRATVNAQDGRSETVETTITIQ